MASGFIRASSGTYTFNSVYVTGNVSIADSAAKVSFASLYVGGTLSAARGDLSLGPTYVAGDSSFSISGKCTMAVSQWTMGLLVTGGNLTVGGSGTYGGDGVGSDPKPITALMTGSSKTITLSGTPTICGLLYDASGALKDSSGGGSVRGTVLCGGGVTASGSLAVELHRERGGDHPRHHAADRVSADQRRCGLDGWYRRDADHERLGR